MDESGSGIKSTSDPSKKVHLGCSSNNDDPCGGTVGDDLMDTQPLDDLSDDEFIVLGSSPSHEFEDAIENHQLTSEGMELSSDSEEIQASDMKDGSPEQHFATALRFQSSPEKSRKPQKCSVVLPKQDCTPADLLKIKSQLQKESPSSTAPVTDVSENSMLSTTPYNATDFVPLRNAIFDITSLGYCADCFSSKEGDHGFIQKTICCPFNGCSFSATQSQTFSEHVHFEHLTEWMILPNSSVRALTPGSSTDVQSSRSVEAIMMSEDEHDVSPETTVSSDLVPTSPGEQIVELLSSSSATHDVSVKKHPHARRRAGFYRCGFCYILTPDLKLICQHYLKKHSINKVIVCEKCNFISHKIYSLRKHWAKFHYASDKMPEFQDVLPDDSIDISLVEVSKAEKKGVSSSTITAITIEDGPYVEHTVENHNRYLIQKASAISLEYSCTFCSEYKSRWFGSLKQHLSLKHWTAISETIIHSEDNAKFYRCITCQVECISQEEVGNHYATVHIKRKTLPCELCEKSFADFGGLKQHILTEMHKEKYRRSIRCTKCLFATLSKKRLKSHGFDHYPSLKCDLCDFKCKTKSALQKHKKAVHWLQKDQNGRYICTECDFTTKIKVSLIHHFSVTHGVNKDKVMKCELCGYVAANKAGFMAHQRSCAQKNR